MSKNVIDCFPVVSRRRLLKLGAASAGAVALAGCVDTSTPASPSKPTVPISVPDRPWSAEQVGRRLAELQSQPSKLYPPSSKLVAALAANPKPVLVYDLPQVEENYLTFLAARPDLDVHYAVKANPNPAILQTVANAGGGFDFASRAELELALATGVSPAKCVYSNTVKFPEDIEFAFKKGVEAFLADSEHEVRKQAQFAPGSKLYVRLLVNSTDAAHPLGDKFGTTPAKAKDLLRLGKSLGLVPYGTHFHVGTQAYSANAWVTPTQQAASIFKDLRAEGIQLRFFDIGGGYPTPFLGRPIPTVKEILDTVVATLHSELTELPEIFAAEPGRGICGTAGVMSSRVMLRAERATSEWIHLDVGLYQGLGDAADHLMYPMTVPSRSAADQSFTTCGPTCDSADTMSQGQKLPGDITEGDLVIIGITGSYSECLFTRFNGIEPPQVKMLSEMV